MRPRPTYGPENPHPLSGMRTELVWEGKYDEYGNRREVDVAGCAMPMQKIETVDQPRSEAAALGQMDLFEKTSKRQDDFRNMLVWGDNKLVAGSLLGDFRGKVDLVYIDPPFDIGADFTMDVPIGDEKDVVEKEQSTLEMVAYRDIWGRGTDSYLHMLFERLALIHDLLSETGSLYVHLDWHVVHYVKPMLDELFGAGGESQEPGFRSEIVWKSTSAHSDSGRYGSNHQSILFYTKSSAWTWNDPLMDYDPEYIKNYFRYKDEDGRRFKSGDLSAYGLKGGGYTYEWNGHTKPWRCPKTTMKRLHDEGRIFYTRNGVARRKQFLDESDGMPAQTIWSDKAVQYVVSWGDEKLPYETQKSAGLLTRMMEASSNEGDLVADLFCGSGTTGAVAEKLGRRWIMADLGRFAIHTTRKRMINLQRKLHEEGKPYRAFDVYNLGRYERQWWQKEHLSDESDFEHRRIVLEFFRAEVLDPKRAPSPLIHGRKERSLCHVDGIDSIFTREEANAVAKAVAKAGGKECYCLAWEFEMELHLTTAALRQETGVKIKLVQIPREIMERNRTSPPPFLEVALLDAKPVYRKADGKRSVDIKLTKFLPSLAEVPTKELEAIQKRAQKSGFDFIDFWAIDFDWRPGKPFNHHWQDYRTRKDRSLKTVSDAGYTYDKRGKHTICVKVVDTFGCDTSITLEAEV